MTMRAWAAEKNGEVIALGGYYLYRGTAVVFTDHKDMTKKEIIRCAHALMEKIRKLNMRVIIKAENEIAARHFGFQPEGDYWSLS